MANTVHSSHKSENNKSTTKYYPEYEHPGENKPHIESNSHHNKINNFVKIFNKGDQATLVKKQSVEKKSPIYIHRINQNNFSTTSNFSMSNNYSKPCEQNKRNSTNAIQPKGEPAAKHVNIAEKTKANIMQHLEEQYWANWKPPNSEKKQHMNVCNPKLIRNRLALINQKTQDQTQTNMKNWYRNTNPKYLNDVKPIDKAAINESIDNDSIYSTLYNNNTFDQNISLKKVGNRLVENYFKQGTFQTVNEELTYRISQQHTNNMNDVNIPVSPNNQEVQRKESKNIEQMDNCSTVSLAGEYVKLNNADMSAQTDFHIEIEYPEKDMDFTQKQEVIINCACNTNQQEESTDFPHNNNEIIQTYEVNEIIADSTEDSNYIINQEKSLNYEENDKHYEDLPDTTEKPVENVDDTESLLHISCTSIANNESKEIVSIYTDRRSEFNLDIDTKQSSTENNDLFISANDSDVNILKHTDSFILTKKKQTEQHSQFQQPKCIRLYKKENVPNTNYSFKGGSYPLRPILKKESPTANKGNLGKPGKSLFVPSTLYSKFIKRK